MDDNSIMPFGKYKGLKMANIPGSYLRWLMDNCTLHGALKEYCEANKEVFDLEASKEYKGKRKR